MRPGQGGDEQARRLSDEVVVGRRVKREVAAHEPCVLINRFQPALPEPDALRVFEKRRARSAEELPGDRPVDEPDRRLECARPVGAHAVRARGKPALQVLPDNVEIVHIAAERIRLCQRHQMQMPVELPEILDVSDQPCVTVIEQLAEFERRFHAGLGIAIPARRRVEPDVLQREQIQLARRNAVGSGEVACGIDFRRRMHPRARCGRKIRGRNNLRPDQPGALRLHRQRAKKAMRNLGGRHAAQPVETPPQPFPYSRSPRSGLEPESRVYEFMSGHIAVPEWRGHGAITRLSAGCT